MRKYPRDWSKRIAMMRNKLGNRCMNCGIVLSGETYHHWKGTLRADSMFLHTHHKELLSEGGNNALKNLTLLCAGCHSYQPRHEHMRQSKEVTEFYQIFRPFYFNKKRAELYEEMESIEGTRVEKVRGVLNRLRPHGVSRGQFEKDFDRLVAVSARQEKTTVKRFDFKSVEQALIMLHFFYSRTTFGVLPTGGGKSLCFTVVAQALEEEGLTVVISPLLSLMQDMTNRFGDKCKEFNSSLEPEERKGVIRQIKGGKLLLLLVSPERLKDDDFKQLLDGTRIARLVIDEAHCISQWGGFRTKYRRIIEFVLSYNQKHQKQLPVLFLTATASERIFDDILASMKLDRNKVAIVVPKSLERPNLLYALVRCKDDRAKLRILKRLLRKPGHKKGIIFCTFANKGKNIRDSYDVQTLVEELSNVKGIEVKPYHGKLANDIRRANQEWFTEKVRRKSKILVSTTAFGMGIDIPDIRFVTHFYPPLSMESYWQETGRAGRDGHESACTLLYSNGDLERQKGFGLLPSFAKYLLILEALVNGRVLIPAELRDHRRFSIFVKQLRKAGILKSTIKRKVIDSDPYLIYSIRNRLTKGKLTKMWKIVAESKKTFAGFRYKRIAALIELFNSKTLLDGKICYLIPTTASRSSKTLSLSSVSRDLNAFVETQTLSMATTKNGMNRFLLEDDEITRGDYVKLKSWLDAERADLDEVKDTIARLVRKRNLQNFANNYWKEELRKLSVVYART